MMIKKLTHISVCFCFALATLVSCSGGGDSSGGGDNGGGPQQIIPTNLAVSVAIQGEDDSNPFGDGSGVFSITATATNAVEYGFKVGNSGSETRNATGQFSYTVTDLGINQFPVYVYAYSETDDRISKIENMKVFVIGNGGSGNNDVLVWFDEFDGSGPLNSSKWTNEVGGGGWGNQEDQVYTPGSSNVVREDGILKIKAIKESNGSYTSARIVTRDKFEFQYGRVDIRAKLPTAQGTWPALWMLGANFSGAGAVGWPQCGEIDIMEQFQDKNKVQATLHWKQSNGDRAEYGVDTSNTTSNQFHVYSIDWTDTYIRAELDGNQYFYMNTTGTDPYFPFTDKDFFFIMNVAMGGTNGGAIDPNFTMDTMEVDYIRVYQ